MFLPLWRTQWPFPAMLSSEILSGSGNPRWNHFPRHDSGNEHRDEEEPEMRGGGGRDMKSADLRSHIVMAALR